MLEVTVPVVNMVNVIAVLDGLATVALGVGRSVISVEHGLGMAFTVVDMVNMVTVDDGLVTVAGQMFVILGFGVSIRRHSPTVILLEIIVNKDVAQATAEARSPVVRGRRRPPVPLQ